MSPWWLLLIVPGALLLGAFACLLIVMWQFAKGLNW